MTRPVIKDRQASSSIANSSMKGGSTETLIRMVSSTWCEYRLARRSNIPWGASHFPFAYCSPPLISRSRELGRGSRSLKLDSNKGKRRDDIARMVGLRRGNNGRTLLHGRQDEQPVHGLRFLSQSCPSVPKLLLSHYFLSIHVQVWYAIPRRNQLAKCALLKVVDEWWLHQGWKVQGFVPVLWKRRCRLVNLMYRSQIV
jgi:hypothetical protein